MSTDTRELIAEIVLNQGYEHGRTLDALIFDHERQRLLGVADRILALRSPVEQGAEEPSACPVCGWLPRGLSARLVAGSEGRERVISVACGLADRAPWRQSPDMDLLKDVVVKYRAALRSPAERGEGERLQRAIGFATGAHRGRVYRGYGGHGDGPYINHPLRVMAAVSERAKVVAVLHGCLEDAGTLPGWLDGEGLRAAHILTRIKEREEYGDYIRRLSRASGVGGDLAREVKIADLRDNLAHDPPLRLRLRYGAALSILASLPAPDADWMWQGLMTARGVLSENCWLWRGGGEGRLESLTCPVVIRPEVLARLLAASAAPVGGGRGRPGGWPAILDLPEMSDIPLPCARCGEAVCECEQRGRDAVLAPPADSSQLSTPAPAPQPEERRSGRACGCLRCRAARLGAVGVLSDLEMVVCSRCGNKRCPHASNHRMACTGSNEPGRVGVPEERGAVARDFEQYVEIVRGVFDRAVREAVAVLNGDIVDNPVEQLRASIAADVTRRLGGIESKILSALRGTPAAPTPEERWAAQPARWQSDSRSGSARSAAGRSTPGGSSAGMILRSSRRRAAG